MKVSWIQVFALAGILALGQVGIRVIAQPVTGTVSPIYLNILSACNPGAIYTAGTIQPLTGNTTGQLCVAL